MANPDVDDTFLTVAEVAETLKLNQQTVRNWIDRGELAATRVGRRVRIKRSDLDRVIQAGYGRGGVSVTGEHSPSQTAEAFWSGEAVGVAVPPPLVGEL